MTGDLFKQAVTLARAGRKDEARSLFRQVLRANPHNETAWIWYADTLPNRAERIEALQTAVRLIPEGQTARRALELLQAQAKPTPPSDSSPTPQPFTILPEQLAADDIEATPAQNVFTAEPEIITRPLPPVREKDTPGAPTAAEPVRSVPPTPDGARPAQHARSPLEEEATSGEKIALIATAIVGIFLFAAVIFLLVMVVMHGL